MRSLFFLSLLGLGLSAYGLFSAVFLASPVWFSFFVAGTAILLAGVNHFAGSSTLFDKLEKNPSGVMSAYMIYFTSGIVIEIVGRVLLHLWDYPLFLYRERLVHVFLIGYPGVFFALDEIHSLVRRLVRSPVISFIVVFVAGALVYEIPNTYAWEWVYSIPYVSLAFLEVNIIVILGWSILAAVSLLAERIAESG